MKVSPLRSVAWAFGVLTLMYAGAARAQFTGDYQTNIISRTTVDWTGTYAVGSNTAYDFLGINSGGALVSDAGGIGVDGDSSGNDAVSVSGTGSVWSNGNDLIIGYSNTSQYNSLAITAGGVVYDNNCSVAGDYNAILISGSGSAWNNSGSVTLGTSIGQAGNSITIVAGGVLSDDTFATGYGGNTLTVMGPGSVWSNRNDFSLNSEGGDSLIISNGGALYDLNSSIGQYNTVLVTGAGSVWSNRNSLVVAGEQTSVIISNGGALYSASGVLDSSPGSALVVTGVGSIWHITSNLLVEGDQALDITDGGVVHVASIDNRGSIVISGGGLYVTNGLGTAALTAEFSAIGFTLNGGTVTVDNFLDGRFTFDGGVLNTKGTSANNGSVFTVGNGTSAATLNLDSGGSGFHSFANGLTISSNATLRGNGTIVGSTMVSGGGVLAPGASPGSITFSNSLTLAQNSTFAVDLDGPTAEQYDQIVVLGALSLSNSVLSLSLGYTPSVGDTYTIISNQGPSAVFGVFVDSQGDALTNNATFLEDGTMFEISYAGNGDGQDVTLTAVVPEPDTWALTGLGIMALLGDRQLRRRG